MKLSIAARIGLGFGIIIIALIINAVFTSTTLQKSEKVNERIRTVQNPSTDNLNDLINLIENSRMLIRSWVFIDKKPETSDKLRLVELHEEEFPEIDSSLTALSDHWSNAGEQELYLKISKTIQDTLFPKHKYIMGLLNSFESYDDPLTIFEVVPMVEEGGEVMALTDTIVSQLNEISQHHEKIITEARAEMDNSLKRFGNFIVLGGSVLILFAIGSAVITSRTLIRPINYIKNILLKMAKGILPENKIKEGNDEIGQMSYALNNLITSLQDVSEFANQIGKGNFETSFKPLSEEDNLGNSLLSMRDELKKAAEEEEKRKEEDAQRNWATQGEAKFGEILRQNNDDMEELSYNIISNLVKYLEANQGGLFLINNNDENDVFIELSSCYAYDRRKYKEKRVELGEGLVGRCIQEGESIYMTDIPNEYINITSGLGGANPRSLLLVPLVLNDEIFGVIELASFKEFQKFEITFVEKVAESIASTISTVRTNIQTTMLLEQSQQQAEEMASQEEEMRQNMEELRATQEQSARREQEMQRKLEEANSKLREFGIEV
jgi:methyl-accepting chemotaxis protein